MLQSDLFFVFVYGTLKPGESNYLTYCDGKAVVMQPAFVQGDLYDFPHFGYPGLTTGESWVQGYLMGFEDLAVLAELDDLEDYDLQRPDAENTYKREWIDVFDGDRKPLGKVWCYRMTPQRIAELGGVPVPSGVWSGCTPAGHPNS